MSERKPRPADALLTELATAIADRTPVDWEALQLEHPELRADLDRLERLERLAAGWRTATPDSNEGSATMRSTPLFAWGPLLALERIGEGSFGEVYRAFDPQLDREVALKLLRTSAGGGAAARHALDEARLQARVRHPNVLVIHGADVHDGRVGLWTDLVPGESLETAVERGDHLTPETIAGIGVDLCRALAAVHDAGLVHGDVTARNVMRDRDGRVLLMDFGSSVDPRHHSAGSSGTPLYLAPEVLAGEPAGFQSDLYALGVLLYRIATGRYPFTADDIDGLIRLHESRRGTPGLESVPAPLRGVMEAALHADPRKRFASAAAMETALSGVTRHASRGATRARGNLSAATSSFVGRKRHIAAIRRELARSSILTLTGAGGCGKSRLGVQALADARSDFADGVWIVELAAVSRGGLVAQTVAREFGIQDESGRTTMDVLLEHLENRRLVLLLDNCEHVLDACATVATEIGAACPDVRILATSREALGVAAETRYEVPPLEVPEEGAEAEGVESVRLFEERAHAANPGFHSSGETANIVAGICRRLDGIPLAIELAASRVRTLDPREIADGLNDRFRLLTGDGSDQLPHHRTLETLIEWSYELLTRSEQKCLARLSVFAGGWSNEAAERVCGGDPIDRAHVRDLLSHLADKSLIERRRGQEVPRYQMLESIRDYAVRHLERADEYAAVAGRHLDCFLELAERLRDGLHTDEQDHWAGVGARDHDNVRAALDHALNVSRIEDGIRLASSMWRFWDLRGHWSEALHYYEALAGHERAMRVPVMRAEALHDAARIAYRMGELHRAAALCQEAIQLLHGNDDPLQRTRYLNTLGVIESTRGRVDAAIRLHEEGLADALRAKDARLTAVARGNLAILFALRGEFDAAHEHYTAMLPMWTELGDRHEVGRTMANLGHVELMRARYDEAIEHLEQAEAIQREISDPGNLAETLLHRAFVLMERGDVSGARETTDEALTLARRVGHRLEAARAREYLGTLAMSEGRFREAAEHLLESLQIRREAGEVANMAASVEAAALLGIRMGAPLRAATMLAATDALRREIGWLTPRAVADRIAAARADLRREHSPEELKRALTSGAHMGPEEMADFALEALTEFMTTDVDPS